VKEDKHDDKITLKEILIPWSLIGFTFIFVIALSEIVCVSRLPRMLNYVTEHLWLCKITRHDEWKWSHCFQSRSKIWFHTGLQTAGSWCKQQETQKNLQLQQHLFMNSSRRWHTKTLDYGGNENKKSTETKTSSGMAGTTTRRKVEFIILVIVAGAKTIISS